MTRTEEHVMIDLETLGTERDSVILSLGAVKFDNREIYEDDGLYLQLKWQDQLDNGGTVTEGTIRFWLGQPAASRDAVLSRNNALHPDEALSALDAWFLKSVRRPKDCGVWAKGPSFDLSLLGDLYRRQGHGRPPWPYWAERCVRTALMMPGVGAIGRPKDMTEHHPFHDAVYQAMLVKKFLIACGGQATKKPTTEKKEENTGDDLFS
jgi:hypothetical protein